MKFKASLALPTLVGISLVAQASSSIHVEQTITYAQTYGLYSPAMPRNAEGPFQLTLGGWKTSQDDGDYLKAQGDGTDVSTVFGADKIWIGPLRDDPNATNESLHRSFAKEGYHVNDPTIVRPPSTGGTDRSKWLYMYFTMLDNRLAKRCAEEHTGQILLCPYLFEGHDIGLASSVDDGNSWTFRGIVIHAAESGDGKGAWMPSAFVDGDDIVVYYHSGRQNFDQENIFRQRFAADGHEADGKAETVHLDDFHPGQVFINVDALPYGRDGSKVLLVATPGSTDRIPLYESADGLHFKLLSPNITEGEGSRMTPFLEYATADGAAGAFVKLWYAEQTRDKGILIKRSELHVAIAAGTGTRTSTATASGTTTQTSTSTHTATGTATGGHSGEDQFWADEAFHEAFTSLQHAHKNGATGDELKPFIDVCIQAQTNARNWHVDGVDQYQCQ